MAFLLSDAVADSGVVVGRDLREDGEGPEVVLGVDGIAGAEGAVDGVEGYVEAGISHFLQ